MVTKAILGELAEFAVGISFEEIPKPVLRQANRCLLDLMGCYWGGLGVEQNRKLLALALEINPKPETTVWGLDRKAGMAEAALAHGCIAHHLEYDDGISLGGHWGSGTIPAALAMAEVANRGGPDVMAAIVVAYEVGNRVSQAFSAELLARGIHFPCTMGVFGATAGVARVAGLSVAQTASALGNACLAPIAPYGPALSGAAIKDAYAGWPNALGIIMTRLSQAGWGGPLDLLEGSTGMGKIMGWTGSARELRKRILKRLGSKFEIMKTYFKPFPCCRWLHAPVRAILDLKQTGGWTGEEVASIRVEGPGFLRFYDKKDGFDQEIAARFSLPYVASASALYGQMGLEEFNPSRRRDPVLRALVHRVRVAIDPEFDKAFPDLFQTRVKVKFKGGKRLEKESGLPWGPDNPPTDKELTEKFSYLAGRVLKPSQIEQWKVLFGTGIETDEKLGSLLGLLLGTRILGTG